MLARIDRLEARIARLFELVAVLMMLTLVAVIAWSVFGRQVLRISVPWSEEVGAGLLAWMVMLGSAAAWSRRRHIAIDVILRRVGLTARWVLSIFVELASLLLFVIAFIGSTGMMRSSAHMATTSLGISYTWLYLALALGLGAMIVFSLLHLARLLIRGRAMVADLDAGLEWSTSTSS
jgi:TRAP-type C4-dicarboxylate transport system permease small subunit